MSPAEQPITWETVIIIVLVGVYLLGGLVFFVYATWHDPRRRRLVGTWLYVDWFFTGPVGLLVCLLVWPLVWLLWSRRSPDRQAPETHRFPEK